MWIHVLVFFTTFFIMEFMAWFSHKYIMHGFLWNLHEDHHKKEFLPANQIIVVIGVNQALFDNWLFE